MIAGSWSVGFTLPWKYLAAEGHLRSPQPSRSITNFLAAGAASPTVTYYYYYHHPLTIIICSLNCEPGQGSGCVKPGEIITRAQAQLILLFTTPKQPPTTWFLVVPEQESFSLGEHNHSWHLTTREGGADWGESKGKAPSSLPSWEPQDGIQNKVGQRAWTLLAASHGEAVNSKDIDISGNGLFDTIWFIFEKQFKERKKNAFEGLLTGKAREMREVAINK